MDCSSEGHIDLSAPYELLWHNIALPPDISLEDKLELLGKRCFELDLMAVERLRHSRPDITTGSP